MFSLAAPDVVTLCKCCHFDDILPLAAITKISWKRWHFRFSNMPLQWRHNERDGVPNHQRRRSNIKLRVTRLCAGYSPVTGEFPAQRASNTKNVSLWWRHYVSLQQSISSEWSQQWWMPSQYCIPAMHWSPLAHRRSSGGHRTRPATGRSVTNIGLPAGKGCYWRIHWEWGLGRGGMWM